MRLNRICLIVLAAAFVATPCAATQADQAELASVAPVEATRALADGEANGSARMAFSIEIGLALLAEIPSDRKVILKSIGDAGDQSAATDVQRFLENNGYDVIRIFAKAGASPPLHRIEFSLDAYDCVLTIAPSAPRVSG
jgi:hypothetical protein